VHAVGVHPAQPLGQVPQQHLQAHLQAGVLGDGHVHGQAPGPVQRPPDQRPADLGEGRHAPRPVHVEHRQARWREHPPRRVEGHGGLLPVVLPGTQDVARAQQLGAEAPVAPDPADEQAGEDQQAEAPARIVGDVARVPRATGQLQHAGEPRMPSQGPALLVQGAAEVGILPEHVDGQSHDRRPYP
jgi:hypothetical protein